MGCKPYEFFLKWCVLVHFTHFLWLVYPPLSGKSPDLGNVIGQQHPVTRHQDYLSKTLSWLVSSWYRIDTSSICCVCIGVKTSAAFATMPSKLSLSLGKDDRVVLDQRYWKRQLPVGLSLCWTVYTRSRVWIPAAPKVMGRDEICKYLSHSSYIVC